MAKPSDHPTFKALHSEWSQKLKESGFDDIEVDFHGERTLKLLAGNQRRYLRLDEITREARVQFFRRLQQHVAQASFETDLERDIMNLYAQGVSKAAIKRVLGIQGHRCKVYYPIYRWLRQWGLK